VIAENEVWCPYCGMDTRPAQKLSNGCVIAMIIVIGYPILVFGSCLIMMMSYPGPSAVWLVPFVVFILPLLLVVLLSWAAVKNRKP
jgi:hypothetical protein